MHGQKLKIFKRPKNREDGSDFDDFRTKKITGTKAVSRKQIERTKRTNSSRQIRKIIEQNFRKILKIDIADIINCQETPLVATQKLLEDKSHRQS